MGKLNGTEDYFFGSILEDDGKVVEKTCSTEKKRGFLLGRKEARNSEGVSADPDVEGAFVNEQSFSFYSECSISSSFAEVQPNQLGDRLGDHRNVSSRID